RREAWLDGFDIPVGQLAPHELIAPLGGFVELELLQMRRRGLDGVVCPHQNPAIGQRKAGEVELVDRAYPLRELRENEPPDVPQFVREVAHGGERGVEVIPVEDHVGAERAARYERPALRVRAVQSIDGTRV